MGFKDFMNNQWPDQCMGCSVGKGDMLPPGGIIYGTENFVLHQDPDVPLSGFLIVAAKNHIRSIAELTLEESTELFQLVYKARVAMKEVCGINEVTIIQEERSGHFHLWLLPRYQWMNDKFGNSLNNIREIMNYSKENLKTENDIDAVLLAVEKLREAFN
ncbi:diadenosine tetraphosphate (Ap4A) HIT family hydrolase [Clostridium punense]|uniref:Diadenosine tetraphosphate (Ap4A) HIT family hydrolase n=1 Tax=Clostridium punense TaxID=1054297 RepID=A0ABS4K8D2_9CLOT|nr:MULTISPECIES: hypothetical protein [Clostridium]EQB86821.1 hypothetical protein M918_12435 [Clostridium sp. BL8]MBP2024043.1 diadenosine tetraphosphate (Ap4A) HIT family hydrolase [Clostridium punense]